MTLSARDFVNALKYLVGLRKGEGEIDDIDHLGNRRLRTIDELAAEELRKGFLKLRRTVQDRMNLKDQEELTPRTLINPKSISAAIDYFFGRGELSQVVDQTNPLSQLTHERRLSALGPGGTQPEASGLRGAGRPHFALRPDLSHRDSGRDEHLGLISSLAIYAKVDELGFLITPYRPCKEGKLGGKVDWLRADEESRRKIAPADAPNNGKSFEGNQVTARLAGDFIPTPTKEVEYVDISPMQMVGVSAGLIPFLEHDDANRALMGSNMQRQAVPLLETDPPVVATGMERVVAENSSMVVRASGRWCRHVRRCRTNRRQRSHPQAT